ncbi:hypothetical protein V7O62_05175 [Methanolobus sp. ZRKC2]|uniref:hypothetical protein n=1 Tax=Methanolobus sp. ZRKC2 TaxID=3125783 RepID=UPI003253D9E4
MQYNRYLLAGIVLMLLILLIIFAGYVSAPAIEDVGLENGTYIRIDNLSKAALIGLPPVIAGFYILTRHTRKRN